MSTSSHFSGWHKTIFVSLKTINYCKNSKYRINRLLNLFISILYATGPPSHVTHLAPQHGLHSYTGDEVEPDDVQHLEDQQQEVEEPPGRVRPHDGPALKQSGVQDPGRPQDKRDVKGVTAGLHASR